VGQVAVAVDLAVTAAQARMVAMVAEVVEHKPTVRMGARVVQAA
jgi:hypothetical protein